MPNKHFCQGPCCHTNPTTDRFLKSKGIIRGRYARLNVDSNSDWYKQDKYFCSQTCKIQWLNKNLECVERGTPVPFITHRRISEGYDKVKGQWGQYTIQKIGVDNNVE